MAMEYWKTLYTDEGAHYDKVVVLNAANLPPIVSWGSSPEDVVAVTGTASSRSGRHCRRDQARSRSSARSTTWA